MLYPCLNYLIQGIFFHRFLVIATPKHSTTVVCAHYHPLKVNQSVKTDFGYHVGYHLVTESVPLANRTNDR